MLSVSINLPGAIRKIHRMTLSLFCYFTTERWFNIQWVKLVTIKNYPKKKNIVSVKLQSNLKNKVRSSYNKNESMF